MATLKRVLGTVCFGCILLWGGTSSFGADWTLYYEDGLEMNYYDKTSVHKVRPGIVQVAVRATSLQDQAGKVRRLELSCKNHMFRPLSDRVDQATGALIPEGAGEGFKWTWFSMESRMMALYENLCE